MRQGGSRTPVSKVIKESCVRGRGGRSYAFRTSASVRPKPGTEDIPRLHIFKQILLTAVRAEYRVGLRIDQSAKRLCQGQHGDQETRIPSRVCFWTSGFAFSSRHVCIGQADTVQD